MQTVTDPYLQQIVHWSLRFCQLKGCIVLWIVLRLEHFDEVLDQMLLIYGKVTKHSKAAQLQSNVIGDVARNHHSWRINQIHQRVLINSDTRQGFCGANCGSRF